MSALSFTGIQRSNPALNKPETLSDVLGVEDGRAVGDGHHGDRVYPQHEVPDPV